MQTDCSRYFWQNEKVKLSRATVEDWDLFYSNYFDSDARFLLDSEVELPRDEDNAKEFWKQFVEDTEKSDNFIFTISSLTGEKVGSAYLNSIDERNGTFGIGMIIDQNFRGKGYGAAALLILFEYAFNERRLHKYNTGVIKGNIGSETLVKKMGCKQEGLIRETIFHEGGYREEMRYGITAEEFNAKWHPAE